ncbi:class I SAM-dependent methyltransferase [Streptomyces sp. XY006]|uniref:class I SAM-dependent methyltransferase n=1 Tax=Streptomyces sp. XY006 TaxID=2021410 RepID=UPI000B8C3C1A|nr:class I SAM-dependent methyltransferase [Streptomyces sp. XY006]OXS36831.1 SAM-dependent methyltransferase [Streptomyces sp. XY006]
MNAPRRSDDDQSARWNGPAGHAWVDLHEVLDGMFRPFEELLVEAVATQHAGSVLDVGCGTGAVTRAVARRAGHCVGIDLSEPMIGAARAYAEREGVPASFVRGDAQEYAFEPAGFDAVVSRFGVMFFADPVRAFTNLRGAVKDGGALRLVVWRGPEENPFMTTAERAAAPFVPDLPPRRPDQPGQFSFADPERVHRILAESGWAGIDLRPVDAVCTLPEKELVRYFTRLGPLGLVLPGADEATRARIVDAVRPAFEPFVQGPDVRFTAACWAVSAQAVPAKLS